MRNISKLLNEEHSLTVSLDNGLYEYFERELTSATTQNRPLSLEEYVAKVLGSELRDDSYQILRARVVSLKQTSQWLRDNIAFMLKLLLVNVTEHPEDDIDQWIQQTLSWKGEKLPEIAIVSVIGEPPMRSPALNANAALTDTQIHDVTIRLEGLAFSDLCNESDKINVSPDELAVHILHNYRDNSHLREVTKDINVARRYFQELSGDVSYTIEKVLLETYPNRADKIREHMDRLRKE